MAVKGISLVGIKNLDTIKSIRKQYPDCWFELSYKSTTQSLAQILPIIEGRVASIHLVAPKCEYFPNLVSDKTYEWSEEKILENADLALKIGATNLVLHPGYLIDGPVFSDYDMRFQQLKDAGLDDYLLIPEELVCSKAYIQSPEYKKGFEVMFRNIQKLNAKVKAKGLNLCLENLNPRAGYMILHPDECVSLAESGLDLCIDVGHLLVTSVLYGYDVVEQAKRLIDTGHVKTMHLHSNPSHPAVPAEKGLFLDSHQSLDKYMPYWKQIVDYASERGVNLILETLEEPLRNIGLLFE